MKIKNPKSKKVNRQLRSKKAKLAQDPTGTSSQDDELRELLLRGEVGRDIDASLDVIIAVCDSLGRREFPQIGVGALHLIVEAATTLRAIAPLVPLLNAPTSDSTMARAVGFARMSLRGLVVLSKNQMTIGPNMLQVVVVDTIHQYVRFFERDSGRPYESFSPIEKRHVASHVAQAIFEYRGVRPNVETLFPAMDTVSDRWRWELDREKGLSMRKPDSKRKARVFFDLLKSVDLAPHSVEALNKCLKSHGAWLLDFKKNPKIA